VYQLERADLELYLADAAAAQLDVVAVDRDPRAAAMGVDLALDRMHVLDRREIQILAPDIGAQMMQEPLAGLEARAWAGVTDNPSGDQPGDLTNYDRPTDGRLGLDDQGVGFVFASGPRIPRIQELPLLMLDRSHRSGTGTAVDVHVEDAQEDPYSQGRPADAIIMVQPGDLGHRSVGRCTEISHGTTRDPRRVSEK